MPNLISSYHITNIVVNDYGFKLFKKVKTIVGDYGFEVNVKTMVGDFGFKFF